MKISDAPSKIAGPNRTGSYILADCFLLFLLLAFHALMNYWWLRTDINPPYYDMAGHALITMRLMKLLQTPSIYQILTSIVSIRPYPPLTYLVAAVFSYSFGPTVDAFIGSYVLFLGLLIFSVYGITQRFVGRSGSLLSAFLVSMYPIIYGLSRFYLLELPLTAMVAFSIFCLFWSEGFKNRVPSLLFGISLGLGMLTKWTFAVFVAGPLLVGLYLAVKTSRIRLANCLIASMVAVVIAAPWYVYNASALASFLQIGGFHAAILEGDPMLGTWASWRYYIEQLLNYQLLLPFTLIFVVAAFITLICCRINIYILMLILWIVVPFVAFSTYANKDIRYTMPYLPAMAVFSGVGLAQIAIPWLRKLTIALVVSYALVQFVGLTIGIAGRPPLYLPANISTTVDGLPITVYAEVSHNASPPHQQDWQIEHILEDILKDVAPAETSLAPIQVGVVPNAVSFEPQTFMYYARAHDWPIKILVVDQEGEAETAAQLEKSQYVVTKTGDLGPSWIIYNGYEVNTQLQDATTSIGRQFELIFTYPLPDGTGAQLYRRHITKAD